MMTRLPFALSPLEGQGFGAWMEAYADRLDVAPGQLADAMGLPDHLLEPVGGGRVADEHIEAILRATGLGEAVVRGMFQLPTAAGGPCRSGAGRGCHDLSVIERLRRASAVAASDRLRLATKVSDHGKGRWEVDPAIRRARRLPDQLWPAWSIRLADDDAFDPATFRPSALVALLVPHSDLCLREIAEVVDERIRPATVGHHLRKLARAPGGAVALQIMTELAFAIDNHDLPIDYARRRQLAVSCELIDRQTWGALAHSAGMRSGRGRRARFARCYLYELLTDCSLHLAPPPYAIADSQERSEYQDFVASLPKSLVDAIHAHARGLLSDAGVAGEPLRWRPPTDWVTATYWPGADPDRTDSAPIHAGLRRRRSPDSHLAVSLGISTEHLRYVLRQHPRPRPPYPSPRLLHPTSSSPTCRGDADVEPGRARLDPAWLLQQYITWDRSLPDIAAELGCGASTLKRFAHEQGISLRRRSGPGGFAHLDAPGLHPSQLPEPLRSALHGQVPGQRLRRFIALAEHPSLTRAARVLGARQSTLTQQLQHLERACGGLLLQRHPRPQPVGPLTPLGERLHRQVLDHLALVPR